MIATKNNGEGTLNLNMKGINEPTVYQQMKEEQVLYCIESLEDCFCAEKQYGSDEYVGECPFHDDTSTHLYFNPTKGVFHCHSCQENGNTEKLYNHLKEWREGTDPDKLIYNEVHKKDYTEIEARIPYIYTSPKGIEIFQVVRTIPKGFYTRRRNPDYDKSKYGSKKYLAGLGGIEKVLFHLPFIVNASTVILLEGEKDVQTLCQYGIQNATTAPSGAGAKWYPQFTETLRNKHVIIIPDTDEAGLKFATKVVDEISGAVKSTKIVQLPYEISEKHGKDVTDFFEDGHTAAELQKLIASATEPQNNKTEQSPELVATADSSKDTTEPQKNNKTEQSPELVATADSSKDTTEDEKQQKKKKMLSNILHYLGENYDFAWEGEKGNLWIYLKELGYWASNGRDRLKEILYTELNIVTQTFVTEITHQVEGRSFGKGIFSNGLPTVDPRFIPLMNGVYDLESCELLPHSPDYYFTHTLPWAYNKDAKWDKLKEIVDAFDNKQTLYELMAYCLFACYTYQKFFILLGGGENGKSLYSTILGKILGQENIAAVSLEDIQTREFIVGELNGKYANVSGEVSARDIHNTRILKQLTGGDLIEAQRKFKKSVKFINHAKLIFSLNKLPKSSDHSDGFYRRSYIIEFNKKFKKNKEADRIVRDGKEEYEGLLLHLLTIAKELYDRDFTFTYDPDINSITEKYEKHSNPVGEFVAERCDTDPDFSENKSGLFTAYKEWCKENKVEKPNPKYFYMDLERMGYYEDRIFYSDGSRPRVVIGLRFSLRKLKEKL